MTGMTGGRWREQSTVAVEAWEAALFAYQVQAAAHVTAAMAAAVAGDPAGMPVPDEAALTRLCELRAAEERALRRYVAICRQGRSEPPEQSVPCPRAAPHHQETPDRT